MGMNHNGRGNLSNEILAITSPVDTPAVAPIVAAE